MSKILLATILLGLSMSASGQTVFGGGGVDCGQMIAHDREGGFSTLYTTWMQGYLTRVNTEYQRNIGSDLSPDAIYFSVLNICRENPTWPVATAMWRWIETELL